MTATHPIEAESFRILRSRVDLGHFDPLAAEVVARVIHASADLEYARTMVVDDSAVAAGIEAVRQGAPAVCDVEMVRHGITGLTASCYLNESGDEEGVTRSALAMRMAARRHPEGAIFVIGCAPTALFELARLASAELVSPALVIGLPVGFVGAVESKEALRACGATAISNTGEKGGSAVAAAACNAIVRMAAG